MVLLTLIQLQYFQRLSHVLHYTRTAKELHISQPSLSYSISELEKELGTPLFQKENRKIALTDAGKMFLPYVERGLAELSGGVERIQQMMHDHPSVVRLGYFHSISASFIPQMMEKFYQTPESASIHFHFTQDLSHNIFCELKQGNLDLAFCMHEGDEIVSIPLMRQKLFLIVPDNHVLAGRSEVTFSDFSNLQQIVLDPNSSLRSVVDEIWARYHVEMHIAFEVKSCDAAVQFVSLNFGVAILPLIPALDSMPVHAVPIEKDDFSRIIHLCWPAQRALSFPVQHVRDFIIKNYKTIA